MKLDETDKPAVYKNLCRGSAAYSPTSEVPESPFYTKIGRQNTLNLYTFQGAADFMVTDALLKMQNSTAGVRKYSSLHSSATSILNRNYFLNSALWS